MVASVLVYKRIYTFQCSQQNVKYKATAGLEVNMFSLSYHFKALPPDLGPHNSHRVIVVTTLTIIKWAHEYRSTDGALLPQLLPLLIATEVK